MMWTGTGNGKEVGRVRMRVRNGLVVRGARTGMRYVTEACCDVVQFVSTQGGARGCHVTGSGQVECLAMMEGPRSLHGARRPGNMM